MISFGKSDNRPFGTVRFDNARFKLGPSACACAQGPVGYWSARAGPSGTSPDGSGRIEAIRRAPGSGREPNGSFVTPHVLGRWGI